MKFLCEYKPRKQPVLTYTRVTKKAIVDHKTKRIQLRQDQHIFELTLPNIVNDIRDMVNRLCDGIYNTMGKLFVPACNPA